jgi:hypothetical protein
VGPRARPGGKGVTGPRIHHGIRRQPVTARSALAAACKDESRGLATVTRVADDVQLLRDEGRSLVTGTRVARAQFRVTVTVGRPPRKGPGV